jgi:hypothetical protein
MLAEALAAGNPRCGRRSGPINGQVQAQAMPAARHCPCDTLGDAPPQPCPARPVTALVAAIGVVALLALGTLGATFQCARRRRPVLTTIASLGFLVAVLAALAIALVGTSLLSWTRLTHEAPAATLDFHAQAPRAFDVDVAYPDGRRERFVLDGDEWQVDARILKWRPFATLIGFDTVYRLERIAGRYADIDTERSAAHTVWRLNAGDRLDVWSLARAANLPWVDARYGSAVYLPMADRAQFEVSVGPSGLVARPRNDAARAAVAGWH